MGQWPADRNLGSESGLKTGNSLSTSMVSSQAIAIQSVQDGAGCDRYREITMLLGGLRADALAEKDVSSDR